MSGWECLVADAAKRIAIHAGVKEVFILKFRSTG